MIIDNRIGKATLTFLTSAFPVIELRSGLPYGVSLGLSYPEALIAAILGNMVPVPFIILYIRHIFHWLKKRSPWWQEKITALEKKAHLKGPTGPQVQCHWPVYLSGDPVSRNRRMDRRTGSCNLGYAAERRSADDFLGRLQRSGDIRCCSNLIKNKRRSASIKTPEHFRNALEHSRY